MNTTEKYAKELKDVFMCSLLENTKNKKFFTQEEYERNLGKINISYNAYNKLVQRN